MAAIQMGARVVLLPLALASVCTADAKSPSDHSMASNSTPA